MRLVFGFPVVWLRPDNGRVTEYIISQKCLHYGHLPPTAVPVACRLLDKLGNLYIVWL
jgi:hypothetical protein